jgi:hypothetical protein
MSTTPLLDGIHQLCAHTAAPIGRLHPERVDVQSHSAKVTQNLSSGVLGRTLQAGSDVPDHSTVNLGHQPHGILGTGPSR